MTQSPQILSARRCGNTTRQVDYYIQCFFDARKGQNISVFDHYYTAQENTVKKLSKMLTEKIVNRLQAEHMLFAPRDFILIEKRDHYQISKRWEQDRSWEK